MATRPTVGLHHRDHRLSSSGSRLLTRRRLLLLSAVTPLHILTTILLLFNTSLPFIFPAVHVTRPLEFTRLLILTLLSLLLSRSTRVPRSQLPFLSLVSLACFIMTLLPLLSASLILMSLLSHFVLPTAAVNSSFCIFLFGTPGDIDYPFSIATSLTLQYNNATPVVTPFGRALTITGGSGRRTYTNKYAETFTIPVTVASSALVYVDGSSAPFDPTGLTLNLASPVQLPGVGPSTLFSQVRYFNEGGGVIIEANSTRLDLIGSDFTSDLPGFINITAGANDINALAGNYITCQDPVSFTDGERVPVQPSIFNGGSLVTFSYTIADGFNYSVTATLNMTMDSPYAITEDMLGNPYQTITSITGTRTYTTLGANAATLTSTVTGLSGNGLQRFYPYAQISSGPGVYTQNTVPLFDSEGVQFSLSPAAPALGGIIGGAGSLYGASRLFVSVNEARSILTEANYINAPTINLQKQVYSFLNM